MQLSVRIPRRMRRRGPLDFLLGFALGAAAAYFVQRGLAELGRQRTPEAVDDQRLLARVRLALAQTTADPDAVDLRVHDGTVILKGPATGEQIAEIVACASRVRGVRFVDNRLSPTA